MTTYTSAFEHLHQLPAIFSGRDMTRIFQWRASKVSQYLLLWKRRGIVAALGGRSDVYANLLVQPNADWEMALKRAMPSALVVGVEVLRRAGWTTQVPVRPTVAVNVEHKVYDVDHFDVVPCEPQWFKRAERGIRSGRDVALPSLRPAWALADLLATSGGDPTKDLWAGCALHADDIAWEQITPRDEKQWLVACKAFGLNAPPLADLVVEGR